MTEDILEQLISSYFLRKPSTFTKHNIKYRPVLETMSKEEKKLYSVNSDIDVISINTKTKNVNVVTCKSWQGGFDIKDFYNLLSNENNHTRIKSGREIWKSFRELTNPIWAKAFCDKIFEETNSKEFNYIIAITKISNPEFIDQFCDCELFLKNLSNNGEYQVKIKFLTIEEIFTEIQNSNISTAVESTEIGRILQLLKSAGLNLTK